MKDRIERFKNVHLNFVPASVVRAAAVKRLAASDLSFPGVEFKIASSEEEMAGAFALLEECYVRRGIARESQMRLQVISLLPTTTTFVARKGRHIIGTLSLIEDSDLGLPMEKVHPSEVSRVRGLYRHIAEVGALAISADHRRSGLSIMLYNMIYRWARHWRHVDDMLIAVHPSARHFYRNILLFETLGAVQSYRGLGGAASLPMRLDIPGAQRRFHNIYHNRIVDRNGKLDFYRFFCAPSDRFDFSSHPEFHAHRSKKSPLDESAVMQLMDRFSLSGKEFAENEATALRRHFPKISFSMDGAA
ncbi:GNAT family N-acetyltransferase [Brachymonas sp. M4Q-1]|uniref:GNAT family N-acetyltransferase n=1 Tax=Brachymonas sp. M4Q-1 TaxID=3416906 RepID=UPI003CEA758D